MALSTHDVPPMLHAIDELHMKASPKSDICALSATPFTESRKDRPACVSLFWGEEVTNLGEKK